MKIREGRKEVCQMGKEEQVHTSTRGHRYTHTHTHTRCGNAHKRDSGLDPALLWLWCRPAAIAPI